MQQASISYLLVKTENKQEEVLEHHILTLYNICIQGKYGKILLLH